MRRSRTACTLFALATTGALLASGCSSSSPHRASAGSNTAATAPGGTAPGSVSAPASATAPSASSGTASTPAGGGSATQGPPLTAPYPTPSDQEDPPTNQGRVLDTLPGSDSASCANVGSGTDVRAGSIAMGNFVTARKQYKTVAGKSELPEVNLYVIPEDTASMKSTTVTVDPLGKGATKKVTSKSVEDADQWRYFAVTIPVAAPGTYRLSVVAGSNRGCFDVTFAN
jgi:hypothetical protein